MDNYQATELLGRGGQGTVFKATDLQGKEVAIKVVDERSIRHWDWMGRDSRVPLEVSLLQHLTGVPGVVQLIEYFSHEKLHYLVMEKPKDAMDLFDFVTTQPEERLSEDVARVIFKQVLEIVHYVHLRGIVHLDLKEENMLIDPATLQVWLIDFGHGRFRENRRFSALPGTQAIAPPEYFYHKRYHGEKAEVWALGVFLSNLLTGTDAFPTPKDTCEGKLNLDGYHFSPELVHLLTQALDGTPARRATLGQLMVSPWMLM